MKYKIVFTVCILLVAFCNYNAVSQNVYYSEMRIKPSVVIQGDLLYVYTSNSMANPSLFIYRVLLAIDAGTKSIFLSANQFANRPIQNQFIIDLKRYGVKEPKGYKFFWLDPDRRKNEIPIISEQEALKYAN